MKSKVIILIAVVPNRVTMNILDDTLRYELAFNSKSFLTTYRYYLDFDLNIETKIIINGKEMSLTNIAEDGVTYLLAGGIDGKYIIEADKNTKDIKLISFNGTLIKSTDDIDSGVIVSFLKTRHDIANNSIRNMK